MFILVLRRQCLTSSGQPSGRGNLFPSCNTRTNRIIVIWPWVRPIILWKSCVGEDKHRLQKNTYESDQHWLYFLFRHETQKYSSTLHRWTLIQCEYVYNLYYVKVKRVTFIRSLGSCWSHSSRWVHTSSPQRTKRLTHGRTYSESDTLEHTWKTTCC